MDDNLRNARGAVKGVCQPLAVLFGLSKRESGDYEENP